MPRLSNAVPKYRKHRATGQAVVTGREKLMAFVSDDDGETWQGGLMIDERERVTYPDGVQGDDGTIYIIYDHNRTPDGTILMAVFAEEDARAGRATTDNMQLQVEVARLPQEQE